MNGIKSVVMAENRKAKMVILRDEKKRPADILKNYLKNRSRVFYLYSKKYNTSDYIKNTRSWNRWLLILY